MRSRGYRNLDEVMTYGLTVVANRSVACAPEEAADNVGFRPHERSDRISSKNIYGFSYSVAYTSWFIFQEETEKALNNKLTHERVALVTSKHTIMQAHHALSRHMDGSKRIFAA